jgi:two-component system response regulator AtoC
MRGTILIVDDEKPTREGLRQSLEDEFDVYTAGTVEEALKVLDADYIDLVLTDLRLRGEDGMALIEMVLQRPRAPVCMLMTAYGSIATAVEALKRGAYDFVTKPVNIDELGLKIARAIRGRQTEHENLQLRQQVDKRFGLENLIGESSAMHEIFDTIRQVAPSRATVLLTGESGTGKELIARAIHYRGPLARMPFIAVDCGSLVPTLMESELFGHEKGSFTGALKTKSGLFQAANGGTIFLDEIGELPLEMQAKLLRVLQEKEIRPVGSNTKVPVDVRVIAATNRNLEESYRAGTFRKDLFFRLNVVAIHSPALRERKSDIPQLVHHFLDRYAPGETIQVTPAAMKSFLQYDWPGNVRELENCVARAVALGDHSTIDVADLPPAISELQAAEVESGESSSLSTTALADLERITILRVFEQAGGDKARAGRMLGISRATLYRKLKRYNISLRHSDKDDIPMAS